jgi:peptide/nickel transport system substrate-binding protein
MNRYQLNCRWAMMLLLFGLGVLMAGCRGQPSPVLATATTPPVFTPAAPTAATTTAAARPSATPVPPTPAPKSLVVCLGEEPKSLYLYGPNSIAAWNILEAVYDGPIDWRGYSAQAVILEKIPSLAGGDAVVAPVSVQKGDEVVDVSGNLVTLVAGIKVSPAGCRQDSCATAWDGKSELKMDQLSVTFKLLSGLLWSDGQPLTAADSVYSFNLAAHPATPTSKFATDRTLSYTARDDRTVQWVGVPGYLDPRPLTGFWLPLPMHLWGATQPADLLQADISAVQPVGWGPYSIVEWTRGDHLTLQKNPNYFRAKEGLPHFDTLVYRFIGTRSGSALNALQAGECDLVDRTARLDEQLPALLELQNNQKAQAFTAAGPEWEVIDFGIKPAAYDDGYKAGDRPMLFSDPRLRQAVALCIDRQAINAKLLSGQSPVIDSYLPAQHPLYDPAVAHYAFDPAAGGLLLDEAGWKDTDNNPATPRVASGMQGVPPGTPLVVNYWTTQAPLRKLAADMVVQSLAQCGIEAKLAAYAPGELFAPGPDGLIFGRKFDLVQFSWESSLQPPCFLYRSDHIPAAVNYWVGENIGGYSSPAYDEACSAGLRSLPGLPGYAEANAKAQELFSQDLPGIPLYWLVKAAAARPGVCGFSLDPSARSDLADLETLNVGPNCSGAGQ